MTQQEALTLKAGDKILLPPNKHNEIVNFGVESKFVGTIQTVARIDTGNDYIYFNGGANALNASMIERVKIGKPLKPAKFSRSDVLEFARQGSNTKLQSELAQRLNNCRTHITNAAKPEEFHKEIKLMVEQLRQAKLIRAAIILPKAIK